MIIGNIKVFLVFLCIIFLAGCDNVENHQATFAPIVENDICVSDNIKGKYGNFEIRGCVYNYNYNVDTELTYTTQNNTYIIAKNISEIVYDEKDDRLFFFSTEETEKGLYVFQKGMTKQLITEKELSDFSDSIKDYYCGLLIDLKYNNGCLFFKINGSTLVKYNIEKNILSLCHSDVSSYVLFENELYFIKHAERDGYLYKLLNNNVDEKFSGKDEYWMSEICADSERIYTISYIDTSHSSDYTEYLYTVDFCSVAPDGKSASLSQIKDTSCKYTFLKDNADIYLLEEDGTDSTIYNLNFEKVFIYEGKQDSDRITISNKIIYLHNNALKCGEIGQIS